MSIKQYISLSLIAISMLFINLLAEGEIKLLANSFDAWKAVTTEIQECRKKECKGFKAELDTEFRKKQSDAFAANPSLYQLGGVSTSTITPLLEAETIRPLDSLVKKWGKNLKPNQLVKENGKIMAIAMMVNNQHFMYREDIFKKLKIGPPQNYNQVLKIAAKIKKSKLVDYPLGGTYKQGWNLAEEFINLYLSFVGKGGAFFNSKNKPTINNRNGIKTLQLMKKLSTYMDPEYLTADSTYVQKQFQNGKIAMANLWATRAKAMNDEKESQVVGMVKMSIAPSAQPGSKPASTLWWDGIVVAKNISNQQAEKAFKAMLVGISPTMVRKNNDKAVWLINGFKADELAIGAIATANAGAPPYPSSPAMAIMHSALGNEIANYLTNKKSAQATLKAISDAYLTAAKEKGLVK